MLKEAILKTLAYADIFDYPLALHEIWKFLISNEPVSQKELTPVLFQIPYVQQKNGYYFFSKRDKSLYKRISNLKHSQKKHRIVTGVIKILSKIPTILFIGITGGLAMSNVEEQDDIDFCIITKKGRLWLTRIVVLLTLTFLGKRRKKGQINVENRICVNMFLDEEGMALKQERQNLYTAHEVVQMQPVFNRNNTHEKFLAANMWVRKFLPNSLEIKKVRYGDRKENNKFINNFLSLLEWSAKKLQMQYMKRNQQIATGVSDHILAFFPLDFEEKVLSRYNKKIDSFKQYEKI